MLLAAAFAACGGGGGEPTTPPLDGAPSSQARDEAGIPVVEVPALWAPIDDLPALVASADVIFVGEVTAQKQQRDGGPKGHEGPLGRGYPVSVFEVTVERVVAGDLSAGEVVAFQQAGGLLTTTDGSTIRIVLEHEEPIKVGERYLLFASQQENGAFATAPFGRMRVKGADTLTALDDWKHLKGLEKLARLPLEAAIREIGRAAAP